MANERIDTARAGLADWAAEFEGVVRDLAEDLEAPVEQCRQDPTQLVPYLYAYLAELPLDELPQDDMVTLKNQFVAFIAQVLITLHGAMWDVVEDATSPAGFRYVLRLAGPQGANTWVDPFAVVYNEFRERPVEVIRMLATAELAIGAAQPG